MTIKFTTKNTKLPGALKGFVEKKLESIEKISGDVISAEVVINEEKLDFKVELIVKTRNNSYHVEDRDPKLKQALRNSMSVLKEQAKKNKEKVKIDKKGFLKTGIIKKKMSDNSAEPSREDIKDDDLKNLTVSDNCSVRPLTVEEAHFFLNESGDNAYMFVNSETDKVSVLYRNRDKGLSIIESVN